MSHPTSSGYDPAVGAASLQPITGPAAWIGEDMRTSTEWVRHFTDAEIAELEQALAHVKGLGRPLVEVRKEHFPLPSLASMLERMRDEVLNGRGFQVLRGLPVHRYSIEESATIYWGIGMHLGRPVPQNAQGHLLGHVRSLDYDLHDPNVRVYQTRERQTFHTDSCDIVALLCLHQAKSGGLSSITSSVSVYNEMIRRRPDLAVELFQPFATDRRGEVPEGMMPYFNLPVFNEYEGYFSVIYARRYIMSAQRFPEVPRLTEAQLEALDLLDSLAEDPRLRIDMQLERGDMQFVCNHVVLHDRTEYEDWPEPERKRHLLRFWLSPPVGRPLPPAYAQRYGSVEIGNRGGIVVAGQQLCAPLEP